MAWAGYHLEIWSASWPLSLKVTWGDWISTLGRAPHLLGAGTPALILPSGSERSKICKLTNACEVCQRRWLEKSLLVQLWKDSVLANTSKNKWISERYFSEDPWGRHRKMIKKKKKTSGSFLGTGAIPRVFMPRPTHPHTCMYSVQELPRVHRLIHTFHSWVLQETGSWGHSWLCRARTQTSYLAVISQHTSLPFHIPSGSPPLVLCSCL